jgi:uncharacterized protein YggE
MAPLNIDVTGSGSAIHTAERGILVVQARSSYVATAEQASKIVATTAASIRELISPHCPQDEETGRTKSDAAISHYSMSTLDTSMNRDRRTTAEGEKSQYDTTYSASAKFNIKFSDFSVLDTLATQISAMNNTRIESVDWRLTDATHNAITSTARKAAAQDTIRRARDYAEVFAGLSAEEAVQRVKAVSVEESGYYTTSTKPQLHYGKMQRAMRVGVPESTELQFQPEDVRLEVKVSGKFIVE